MFLFVNISKCRIEVIGKHVKKGVNLMYIARPFPNSLSFQVQYLSKNNNIKYYKLKQEYNRHQQIQVFSFSGNLVKLLTDKV